MAHGARVNLRRMLLAFTHEAAPQPALEAAAEFARLLDTGLQGLFVEDSVLFEAASVPLARLLDPTQRTWRPMSYEHLSSEYAAAAAALRRRLKQVAAANGLAADFTIVRGDWAASVASHAGPTDLLAVFEPPGTIAGRIDRLRRAAGQSRPGPPAILYLAPSVRRRGGPVVAVATAHGGAASVELAAQLAAAASEQLVIIDLTPGRQAAGWLERAAPQASQPHAAARVIASSAPPALVLRTEFVRLRARLVVLDREAFETMAPAASDFVDGRQVPWMILEGRAGQAED
ncbi:MAG TPA: hypothetical protein VF229_08575 [Burkholderiaceae bacterium]